MTGNPDDGTDMYTEANHGGKDSDDICQLQAQYTKPCEGQEPYNISEDGRPWKSPKRSRHLGK